MRRPWYAAEIRLMEEGLSIATGAGRRPTGREHRTRLVRAAWTSPSHRRADPGRPSIARASPNRRPSTACSMLVTGWSKGNGRSVPGSRFGFWRGFVDGAVARYLDCGILENGFARVRCGDCRKEMLVGFSCKGRGICPSCGAKRAAETAARLREDVLEPVGHAQWVFTVPKMLRPYFLRHRELLGGLCRAAWQTVREMIAAAAGEDIRPGMVAVVQTFGSKINFHPHVHEGREPRRMDEDGPVGSRALCGCEGGRVAAAAQSAPRCFARRE